MDTTGLGMKFGDFYTERLTAHVMAWLTLGFFGLWIAFYSGSDDPSIAVRLTLGFIGAVLVAFCYGLSCLVLVPLLPLLPLAWLSIWLEARWRIHHRLPYVPLPSPPMAPPGPVARGGGGWLLPLMIGIWIGGAWGDDD
jgi:hypothetical protein